MEDEIVEEEEMEGDDLTVATRWSIEEVADTDTVGDTDSGEVFEGVSVGVCVTEIVIDGEIEVVGEKVTEPPEG
jgi:hypothetical protein